MSSYTPVPNKSDGLIINTRIYFLCLYGVTQWCSGFRHCSTSRKVKVSIPGGVIGIFH